MKSDNFELFTTASERKGRDVLRYFEQVRTFFVQSTPGHVAAGLPVRIVAFNSGKEFEPYKPTESAAAYYVGGHDREYIVLQSISSEFYPAVVHEYVHLIVKTADLEFPLWLNEGLADLYSTLRPVANSIQVGGIDPGRYQALKQQRWLPLGTLLTVDQNSPYYNEKDRASIFYSQSWALVHMLHFDEKYRANFGKLLGALAAGQPADQIFKKLFNRTLPEVEKDLAGYMASDRFYVMNLNLKLEKRSEEPDAAEAPRERVDLILAQILMRIRKNEASRSLLEALSKTGFKDPEVEESLAYLDTNSKDFTAHLTRAAELGSRNPRVYYDLAYRAERSARRTELLRRVLEINPEFPDIRYALASSLLNDGNYQGALEQLRTIKPVKTDHAFRYFFDYAFAAFRMKSPAAAEDAVKRARTYAKSPEDTERLENLSRAIAFLKENPQPPGVAPGPHSTSSDSEASTPAPALRHRETPATPAPAPPPAPRETATGRFVRLDCINPRARVKLIDDQGQDLYLMIDDPTAVAIQGKQGATMELACGPQQPAPHVTVEYIPRPDVRMLSAGVLRKLRFD